VSVECPTADDLGAFAEGAVSADHAALIERHLDRCAACRRLVSTLAAAGSSDDVAMLATVPTLPAATGGGPHQGQRLGRFTLVRRLGEGGMGEVWAAHDPELDREVALKLLHVEALSLDDDARARLRREAQAMARLTHPNVVRIYELASDGELVFCAMELVDGVTLRDWLGTRRPWREVLAVLLDAGRGVAAAHAAGLVHRDVKPDNILIARDGRTLVGDFGLAKLIDLGATEPVPASLRGALASGSVRTRTGAMVGTPLYMPPEQLDGGDVDALSDQFSFCVSMYEALFGARPYDGATLDALAAAVRKGAAPPADRRDVPRPLVRCILRGLATDKHARWPSMDALLAAIERAAAAPRRRRRWLVAAAAVSGLVAGVAWLAPGGADREHAMRTAARERIARAWGPARADALRGAFARSGDPAADALASAVIRAIDRYRDEWLRMRVDAWSATHRRGEQSQQLLELRTACLDRLSDELDSFVQIVAAADQPEDVKRAAQGVHGLTPVSTCADRDRLAAVLPGSSDPAQPPERFRAIELEEARLRAILLAGRPDDALAHAKRLVADAERLGEPRLHAALLLLLDDAQQGVADYEASEATLRRVIEEGARARDLHVVASAWIRLIETLGVWRQRPRDALALELAARAAVAQAGDQPDQRAELAAAIGSLAWAEGDSAGARARWQEAFDGFRAALGPNHARTADTEITLAQVIDSLGEHDAATRHVEHALEIMRGLGREDDPITAKALKVASRLARDRGDLEAAVGYGSRAVDAMVRIYGSDHPSTAYARCNLGLALSDLQRHAEAVEQLTLGEAALRRTLGAAHADVSMTQLDLGEVLEKASRFDEAERIDRTAVESMRSVLAADHPNLAYGLSELARMVAHRAPAEAIPLYDEAMQIDTAHPDRNPEGDASMLQEIAATGLAAHRPDWALGWFGRLPAAAAQLPELEKKLRQATGGRNHRP